MARPRIIFVVAHDRRGVMGREGGLPWHLPADLKHFKSLTIGKPIVMGRKTYASIGKPLPQRKNIVMTRDRSFSAESVEIAHTVEEALALAGDAPEIAVIGGAQVFNEFAALVDTAFVTDIDADVAGDVYYTPPQRKCAVATLGVYEPDERNEYKMTFMRFDYESS